eukprot:7359640-Prymnesium_polylepis.1
MAAAAAGGHRAVCASGTRGVRRRVERGERGCRQGRGVGLRRWRRQGAAPRRVGVRAEPQQLAQPGVLGASAGGADRARAR